METTVAYVRAMKMDTTIDESWTVQCWNCGANQTIPYSVPQTDVWYAGDIDLWSQQALFCTAGCGSSMYVYQLER